MINFPNAPAIYEVFTDATAGHSWRWDGVKWTVYGAGDSLPWAECITVHETTTLVPGFGGTVLVENTTSGPISIILPPGPQLSQPVLVKDSLGNASFYPITVIGTGVPVEGATSVVLRQNFSWVDLMCNGSQWVQT